MISKKDKIQVAVFVLSAIFIAGGFILFFTGLKLFQKKEIYFVKFTDKSVSGLNIGSKVEYNGVNIGVIEEISIDSKNIENIIVKLSLIKGTPVKTDTEASIVSQGITGLKYIELIKGSNESEFLKPGGYIKTGVSFFDEITGKASIISAKVEKLLNNLIKLTEEENQNKLLRIIDNTDKLIRKLDLVIEKKSVSVEKLIDSSQIAIKKIDHLIEVVETSVTPYGKLIGRSDIETVLNELNFTLSTVRNNVENLRLNSLVEEVKGNMNRMNLPLLTKNVEIFLNKSNSMVDNLDLTVLRSREDIFESLYTLRESLENFNEFTRIIKENPSLLFRGGSKVERGE